MTTISHMLYGFASARPNEWSDELWRHARTQLGYVNELAQKVHHDIDHWDVLQMFKMPGKKRRLIDDKSEINRIFFEQFEKEKENLELRLSKMINAAKEDLVYIKDRFEGVDNIEELRKEIIHNVEDLSEQIQESWDRIRELDIAQRSGKTSYNIVEQVTGALKTFPFYTFLGCREGSVRFATAPITLSEKNPAAGLDIKAFLGSFQVVIDPRFNLSVFTHKDNIRVNNYYHPHVDTRGKVCWGSAYGAFNRARLHGNITDMLAQAMAILCHFNPGNPFVALLNLQKAREEEEKKREFLEAYNQTAEVERQALEAEPHDPNQTYHAVLEQDVSNDSLINLLVHTPHGVYRRQFTSNELIGMRDRQEAMARINNYRRAIERDVRGGFLNNHPRVRMPEPNLPYADPEQVPESTPLTGSGVMFNLNRSDYAAWHTTTINGISGQGQAELSQQRIVQMHVDALAENPVVQEEAGNAW